MRPSLRSRGVRGLLMVLATIGLLLVWVTPASAVPGPPRATPRTGPNTDLIMTGTGPGQGVTGAIGPVGTSSDPSQPYPAAPPSGFTGKDEGFAGIIHAQSVQTQEQLSLFCIDIRTDTYPGIGYENGTWDASNVPNVGYIARILNDYYPNTGEPAAAPNDNVRAAAVQAAIWYFSDNYVLQPNEPVRAYTEAIVEAARTAGPLPQPSPPNLVIDPTTDKGPANEPLGPYTVSSRLDRSRSEDHRQLDRRHHVLRCRRNHPDRERDLPSSTGRKSTSGRTTRRAAETSPSGSPREWRPCRAATSISTTATPPA